MVPIQNEYTDLVPDSEFIEDALNLEIDKAGERYRSKYVSQILAATDMLAKDMLKATNQSEVADLQHCVMARKGINKDKLCVWLETACGILNLFCTPALGCAQKRIDHLTEELISHQKTIIDLQEKLIEKKDEELGAVKTAVQTTVQSEMNSYSSVLRKTCNEALAPRRMQAAMKSVAVDEDRSKNLIVYGLAETKEENLEEKVSEVLQHLGEKPRIVNCCRMGKDVADGGPAVKPIKFTLAGTDLVRQILSKTRRLREVEGYTSVYICPDRSAENRLAFKKLVDEVKQRRTDEPNRVHVIKNFKIVSSEKG
jgi:hypothetical protein